jgi:hypothetical protein
MNIIYLGLGEQMYYYVTFLDYQRSLVTKHLLTRQMVCSSYIRELHEKTPFLLVLLRNDYVQFVL